MSISIIKISTPQQPISHVQIEIETKTNWSIVLPTGAWLLLWFLFLCWTAYKVIWGREILDFNLVQVMMLSGGLFSLVVISRNLARRETILLTDETIQITESGLLAMPATYELALVSYFSYDPQESLPEWKRFWGLDSGKVTFGYMDMRKRFGYRLNQAEAEEIIQAIESAREEKQPTESNSGEDVV